MRKAISKKLRFEVFKRDGFACQYCGKKAPDVVLHVDHVSPVSKGGQNDILNLITSCSDCNLGKGPRELDDSSALAKQQEQLAELNEKREQLRMMLKWREELKSIDAAKLEAVIEAKQGYMPGWIVNDKGKTAIEKLLREFPIEILLDAIDVSCAKIQIGPDGKATKESVDAFSDYIPRVANCKLRERKEPGIGELLRLRGWLRTFMDFRDWECIDLLKRVHACGISADELRDIARDHRTWYQYSNVLFEILAKRE